MRRDDDTGINQSFLDLPCVITAVPFTFHCHAGNGTAVPDLRCAPSGMTKLPVRITAVPLTFHCHAGNGAAVIRYPVSH